MAAILVRAAVIAVLATATAGCAERVATVSAPVPHFTDADAANIESAALHLRQAFEREVPEHLPLQQGEAALKRLLTHSPQIPSGGSQAVLAVDRAPAEQTIWILIARQAAPWVVVGGTHVSTGRPGRKEHYLTPVGTFLNDGSILGYRAQGTFNENHIRGLGLKGMRVWDFGWQTTDDWRTPGASMQIRLAMHATDPDYLESRIGRPDSEGCIRIPASMNAFIDTHGVIDAALTAAAPTDRAVAQLISRQRDVTPLAGSAVIVYDTSEPAGGALGDTREASQ